VSLIDRVPSFVLSLGVNAMGLKYRVNRYSPSMRRRLSEWIDLERTPVSKLESLQIARLKYILSRAQKTKFYSERFKLAQFDVSKFRGLEDLERLPILEREDLARNFEEMIVPDYRGDRLDRKSSGTTGQPVTYRQPKEMAFSDAYAMLYQFYSWHGIQPLESRATLAGRYLGVRRSGLILRNYFENQLLLSVHSLNVQSVNHYAAEIAKFKPKILQAHPSALLSFIQCAESAGVDVPRIPVIAFTGETLLEEDRESIARAFQAKVFGTYGCGENHIAGGECAELNGYHLHPMIGVAELMQGSAGPEVIGTSLLNDVMPLIRYRTGDIVQRIEYAPCGCGRTWPRLVGLTGRSDDFLRACDGSLLPPVTIRTGISAQFGDLPPYSIVQRKENSKYLLRFYVDSATERARLLGVAEYIRCILGECATVDLEVKNESERLSARGKHRVIIKE